MYLNDRTVSCVGQRLACFLNGAVCFRIKGNLLTYLPKSCVVCHSKMTPLYSHYLHPHLQALNEDSSLSSCSSLILSCISGFPRTSSLLSLLSGILDFSSWRAPLISLDPEFSIFPWRLGQRGSCDLPELLQLTGSRAGYMLPNFHTINFSIITPCLAAGLRK